MIAHIISLLVALGYRHWRDIDHDQGQTLQCCDWTGERRTVVYGYNIRRVRPWLKPRWEQ